MHNIQLDIPLKQAVLAEVPAEFMRKELVDVCLVWFIFRILKDLKIFTHVLKVENKDTVDVLNVDTNGHNKKTSILLGNTRGEKILDIMGKGLCSLEISSNFLQRHLPGREYSSIEHNTSKDLYTASLGSHLPHLRLFVCLEGQEVLVINIKAAQSNNLKKS